MRAIRSRPLEARSHTDTCEELFSRRSRCAPWRASASCAACPGLLPLWGAAALTTLGGIVGHLFVLLSFWPCRITRSFVLSHCFLLVFRTCVLLHHQLLVTQTTTQCELLPDIRHRRHLQAMELSSALGFAANDHLEKSRRLKCGRDGI